MEKEKAYPQKFNIIGVNVKYIPAWNLEFDLFTRFVVDLKPLSLILNFPLE